MKRNLKNHLDLPSDFSLESLRDQNPFKVPDGYFDELPNLINQRIQAKPIIKKSRRLHPGVFAAAASVVLLIGLAVVMHPTNLNDSSAEMQLAAIPDTHIVKHLDNAITNGEIDEPILMEAVANVTAPEATTTSTPTTNSAAEQSETTGILPTVSDEVIIEYLVQNETNPNLTSDIIE